MNNPNNNGWKQWAHSVCLELERLSSVCENLNKDVTQLKVEMATIKVKAGLLGFAAGAIPPMVGMVILLIKLFLK